MQTVIRFLIANLVLAASAYAGVTISSPAPGSTSTSPVHFVASASSSAPITAMRIYVDNVSVFTTSVNNLDTFVSLAAGSHNVMVQAWDSTGAVFGAPETINVTAASGAVAVSSPSDNATVSSPFQVAASASGSNPITAMQIYLDDQLVFTGNGSSLNTQVSANPGVHNLVVQAWDSNGGVFKAPETINVTSGVAVSSPSDNATVSSPFQVVASASAPLPITAMIAYLDSQAVVNVSSASMNASVSASAGAHSLVVQAWDSSGALYRQALTVNVSSSLPPGAITQSEIQNMSGWESCTTCAGAGGSGPSAGFSLQQFQSSPALSGSSAKFNIWGSTPYSNALWWKQLGSDDAASNFRYDVDFYLTDPQAPQALEFDVNQSIGNLKFIFGTQCAVKDGVWDVWDTAGGAWQSTGVPCSPPAAFTWHHLTWELQRNSTQTIFVALTLDGEKHFINRAYNAKPMTASELNVAFQMDMNSAAQAYSVWLDNVTLSYW